MNLVDCHVEEVLSPPEQHNTYWLVPVRYNSWGREGITHVFCKTKEEAEKVAPGYVFQQ